MEIMGVSLLDLMEYNREYVKVQLKDDPHYDTRIQAYRKESEYEVGRIYRAVLIAGKNPNSVMGIARKNINLRLIRAISPTQFLAETHDSYTVTDPDVNIEDPWSDIDSMYIRIPRGTYVTCERRHLGGEY